jgi:berberine-like enzyme
LIRFSSGGHLLTMTGDVGEQTLRAAFGNNHKRMVELKAKYDPTNLFVDNQRVQTAPTESVRPLTL